MEWTDKSRTLVAVNQLATDIQSCQINLLNLNKSPLYNKLYSKNAEMLKWNVEMLCCIIIHLF